MTLTPRERYMIARALVERAGYFRKRAEEVENEHHAEHLLQTRERYMELLSKIGRNGE